MDRYEESGMEQSIKIKKINECERTMRKRYRMYYSGAAGKIEMYLFCRKYHMSGYVLYDKNSEMMVELYGEERTILNFMSIIEQYLNRKPCKVIEMDGEPEYGIGEFRFG